MSSLRADLTALLDRAREDGSKVVAIEAVELVLHPRHQLTVEANGDWALRHPYCDADCGFGEAVATAPLLSSPHARGRTYDVWLDDDHALKFLDTTGREP